MSQKFGAFVYLSCLLLSIPFLSLEKVNAQEFQEHFTGPNGGAGFNSGIYHTPFYYFVGQYVDSTRRTHTIAYCNHLDGKLKF